jgi:tetratricopeptide (TPR) repeat protein
VRGELDWIVMKALEKDRNRRYETANAFAMDVQRYLADEPVAAGPPSARYKLGKFLRRHRTLVRATLVVTVLTVLGLAVGTWLLWQEKERTQVQWLRAETEAAKARAEAQAKARESQRAQKNWRVAFEALRNVYLGVAEKEAPRDRHGREEYQKLLRDGVRYFETFAEQNSEDREVQWETAVAYHWVAKLQRELGQHKEAETACRRAIVLFQEFVTRSAGATDAQSHLARSYTLLAGVLRKVGRNVEAEKNYLLALRVYQEVADRFPDQPSYKSNVAATHMELGELLETVGRLADAEVAHRAAIRIQQQLPDRSRDLLDNQLNLTGFYANLSQVLWERNRFEEAEKLLHRVVALREELVNRQALGKKPPAPRYLEALAMGYYKLGDFLRATKRAATAEDHLRQAAALFKKLGDELPGVPDYRYKQATALDSLRLVLLVAGRGPEAEKVDAEVFHLLLKLVKDHGDVPDYKSALARWHEAQAAMLQDTNHLGEAEKTFRDVLALRQELVDAHADQPLFQHDLARAYSNLGELLRLLRRYPEAKDAHQKAVSLTEAVVRKHVDVARFRDTLASSLYNQGVLLQTSAESEEAEKVYRRIVDPFEKQAADPALTYFHRGCVAASYGNLATMWAQRGRLQDAERMWGQALPILEELANDFPKDASYQNKVGITLSNMARTLRLRGKLTDSRKLYAQGVVPLRQAVELEPHHAEYAPALRNHYMGWLDTLLRLKEHVELAQRANEFAHLFPERWEDLYIAAGFFQNCKFLADKDPQLSGAQRTILARKYTQRAGGLFRSVSRKNPAQAEVQNQLAMFLNIWEDQEKEDAALALAMAKKAVAQAPRNGFYRGTLGVAYYRAGEWQTALQTLEETVRLPKGKDVFIDLFLAMARSKAGRQDQARKDYDSVVHWMAQNPSQVSDALRRLQVEAAAVLGITNQPTPKKEQ